MQHCSRLIGSGVATGQLIRQCQGHARRLEQ